MLNEKKVFKDNVLGYIEVDNELIWDLINTKEFQRLRRINHLGGVGHVFHTASHSRFAHSLGVYETARRMIEHVNLNLTSDQQLVILCAALLHDIGHGPFSHAFELISEVHHEKMSIAIINGKSDVNKVLMRYNPSLASEITKVIDKSHDNKLLVSLISSQIDVDRLDYLVRDAYNSGAVYGIIDVERLFRITKIVDNKVCFKITSLKELEIYLMSRICMYEQIYFHPTARSYEILLSKTLERFNDLKSNNFEFKSDYSMLDFSDIANNLGKFYMLDDYSVIHFIKCFMLESDEILSDLSRRFIERDLFKHSIYSSELEDKIRTSAIENNFDIKYYVVSDYMSTKYYDEKDPIYLFDGNKILDLNEVSQFITGVDETITAHYIYYPSKLV